MLFKTVDEIRSYCPVLAKSCSWTVIAPLVKEAEEDFIIKYLSQAQYNEIEPMFQAGVYTAKPKAETLVKKVQASLAYYVVYKHALINQVQATDNGLQENQNEKSAAARMWLSKEVKQQLISQADTNLDKMLEYLETEKAVFTLWAASGAYALTKDLYINSAKEFDKYFAICKSRTMYQLLRPYIVIAEEVYILPAIGKEQHAALKTKILAGNATPNDLTLIDFINKALAMLAVFEAIPFINVVLNPDGLRTISTRDGITENIAMADAAKNNFASSIYTRAMPKLVALKEYIEANTDKYPVFAGSSAYQNNTPKNKVNDNSNSSIFRI